MNGMYISACKILNLSIRVHDPSLYVILSSYAKSQSYEDIWLYENWFYGMKRGVILESGALDGIVYSNSYLFEKFADWTAIHIEADPGSYNNLVTNRPNAINIHCGLCDKPKILHYAVGTRGVATRGFIELMSPSFLKRWHPDIYNGRTKLQDFPVVQCVRLNALLQELRVSQIDLWVLDIEGAEASVLRSMDFSSVTINAIVMECDNHDKMKDSKKISILETNGFKCQLVERNCMCKSKLYKASSAPIKSSNLRKWNGVAWMSELYNVSTVTV